MGEIRQMDLFSEEVDLKIKPINSDEVERDTDDFKSFVDLILRHEDMYPGIDKWLKNKVVPGIKSGERVSYIGLKNDIPVISSVVKKGKDSKFCHLHIENELHDNLLGDLFFSMMAVDIRNNAQSVYFTLPEALWYSKEGFFKSFGFTKIQKSDTQYRNFETELKTSTPHRIVWDNMIEKLPKMISTLTPTNEDIFTGLLMSVKPEYIERIQDGNKLVEIRKQFSKKWDNFVFNQPDSGFIWICKNRRCRKG